jgi:hypothetical protein
MTQLGTMPAAVDAEGAVCKGVMTSMVPQAAAEVGHTAMPQRNECVVLLCGGDVQQSTHFSKQV